MKPKELEHSNTKVTPLPRLSDFHSLEQIAKFELSELDDTIINRTKIFHELLNESIKEISKTYLEDVDETTLQSIKSEFGENSFPVSQQIIWKNGEVSYNNQVEKIPSLKNLIESKLKTIEEIQNDFKEKITSAGINSEMILYLKKNMMNYALLLLNYYLKDYVG